MKSFFKWLLSELSYLVIGWVFVFLIAAFGMLAVTFWPAFAMKSIGLFVLFLIAAYTITVIKTTKK